MAYTFEKRNNEPNKIYVSQPWISQKKDLEQDLIMEKKFFASLHEIESNNINESVFLIQSQDRNYYPNDPRCN
jgi:hypothetical protein